MNTVPASADALLACPARRARVARRCAALVGDAAAAEDLAQETLLTAWRLRDRLTDPTGVDAWLNAIARNLCLRWLRARGSADLPTDDPEFLARTAGPGSPAHELDTVLERQELVELLELALGLLPAGTRDLLVGHYVERLSHAELAARTGTSADAVSMRVSRGRARLRHLLETRFADDALAEGWVRRDDAGWRATRVACPDCGRATVQLRRDPSEVAFRCTSCDASRPSVHLDLDAPVFAGTVAGVQRPTALQGRIADWVVDYWDPRPPAGSRPVSCVRCGRPVTRHRYTREEQSRWSSRNGWYARCAPCGQEVCTSVAGLTLALPELRAARKRNPRLRLLEPREVVRDGRPAMVLPLGTGDGPPVASAVFLRDSLALVHVDAPQPV